MVKCQQGILGGRGANKIRALLNVIWLVFCGLWMALAYVAAASICFVLIVTIPFGIASMRIAGYVLWPFGRTIEPRRDSGVGSLIGNILWVILFGWWLAIGLVLYFSYGFSHSKLRAANKTA